MFRMLSAILLASPAGMGGGVLCLLGLIWCFSPAPLPLALATLLTGMVCFFWWDMPCAGTAFWCKGEIP